MSHPEYIMPSDNCFIFPSWVKKVPELPFVSLEIQMVVIFCVNQMLHHLLFKHICMPPLVSQLFAGLMLGYTGFGRFAAFRNAFFPPLIFPTVKCIILFTYTISLFIVATQIDFSIIRRTGKKPMLIGLVPFVFTLGTNFAAMQPFQIIPKNAKDIGFAVLSLPVAAFPSLVRLVTDIGLVNSELGRLTLSSGLFVEIASLLTTMAMNFIVPNIGDRQLLIHAAINLSGVAVVVVIVIFVVRPIMYCIVQSTPKDRPIKFSYVLFAFFTMLLGALMTDTIYQFVFLGAFIVGLGLPDGPPLGSAVVEKFDALLTGVLHPFFVTSAAMRINISVVNFKEPLARQILVLLVITTVLKVIFTFVCGLLNSISARDALALAFLMSSKGFLEIGTMTWLRDTNILGRECFTMMALHVVFMATVSPLVVKLTYDPMRKYSGYQIRDMMHLKSNSHLKVVACVLRLNNISSITNVLQYLNPTRNVPISAFILHLVKLVGRYQPLFISHDMQKKQSSHHSYSEDVIWHFERLQQPSNSNGSLSTHVYTALAQVEAMHEYVCTLALDKVISIIILPFHRRFGMEGLINSEDHEQRLLNTSILARSPCSVAIFVDRSNVNLNRRGTSSESGSTRSVLSSSGVLIDEDAFLLVAVIVIGGNDDREALAFAKRMLMSHGMRRVKLNVIRLATPGDGEEFMNSLDAKAIVKFLHEIKFEVENRLTHHQVTYVQVTVKDGIETVNAIQSMAHEYNLIIVGRRFNSPFSPQVAGLEESCEIKELGILGDLLASPDLKCATSILVVQQQQICM